MAIQFPTALDTFENPTQFDQGNAARVPHWQQESDQNDAIEELERLVGGMIGLTDATPVDYIVMRAPDLTLRKVFLVIVEGEYQLDSAPYP